MPGKDKTSLVKCSRCGEYYSVTYKNCPFCDDYDDDDYDYEDVPRRSGGKRLVTNTRGGGYGRGWTPGRVIVTILSIVVIIAAICIVLNKIKPLIDRGRVEPTPTPPASQPAQPTHSTLPTPPVETDNPDATPPVIEPANPTPSQIPSTQTATGFTLSRSDFTLSYAGDKWTLKANFTPAGSTGFIESWTSSNSDVATVSAEGTVTAVSRGTCTITATMAGGVKQSCIVRCTFATSNGGGLKPSPSAAASPSPSAASGEKFTLNRSDFTLDHQGETFTLRASGAPGDVSWSISNSAVATISSGGTVTAVSEGTCTVTATSGGQSVKCIVRVNFK